MLAIYYAPSTGYMSFAFVLLVKCTVVILKDFVTALFNNREQRHLEL